MPTHTTAKSLAPEVLFRYSGEGMRAGTTLTVEAASLPESGCSAVGISAMTSYVNRGYEIADQFRAKGVPVVMGGVHPSFMPQEALKHCNAAGVDARNL